MSIFDKYFLWWWYKKLLRHRKLTLLLYPIATLTYFTIAGLISYIDIVKTIIQKTQIKQNKNTK